MGYYTSFQLGVYDENKQEVIDNEKYEKLLADFKKVTDYDWLFDDSCKWYDQDEDTIKVSKMNPELYLFIRGEGEESGDIWARIYKAGKVVADWTVEISEPDFEELLENHSV